MALKQLRKQWIFKTLGVKAKKIIIIISSFSKNVFFPFDHEFHHPSRSYLLFTGFSLRRSPFTITFCLIQILLCSPKGRAYSRHFICPCGVNVLPCVHSRGHFFSLIIMKLGQNVCLIKSRTSLKMGHVRSKTRSLGQILEKHLCTL